jgi:hypothetical protein
MAAPMVSIVSPVRDSLPLGVPAGRPDIVGAVSRTPALAHGAGVTNGRPVMKAPAMIVLWVEQAVYP